MFIPVIAIIIFIVWVIALKNDIKRLEAMICFLEEKIEVEGNVYEGFNEWLEKYGKSL